MNEQLYTIKCTVSPPGVIYINEPTVQNQFTLNFRKTPLHIPQAASGHIWLRHLMPQGAEPEYPPILYIFPELSPEPNPHPLPHYLCTRTQAANTQFIRTMGEEGWTLDWVDAYDCFEARPPAAFSFPADYQAAFRSVGFLTTALEGAATLTIFGMNFPDLADFVTTVEIHKRYPVAVRKFSISPQRIPLGGQATLTWETQGADHCWITGLGDVDTSSSRKVMVAEPTAYTLFAENSLGRSQNAACSVLLEKPTAKLTADKSYCAVGGKVTLAWETSSAAAPMLLPEPGILSQGSGSTEITFYGDTTYSLVAPGYDGAATTQATASLRVETTPWVREGALLGVTLTEPTGNTDQRVWAYQKKRYLFESGKLWSSGDGLSWSALTDLVVPAGMKLEHWSTTIAADTFYVLGGTQEGKTETWAFLYDLKAATWSSKKLLLDFSGVTGSMCVIGGLPLYAHLSGEMVLLYMDSDVDEQWAPRYLLSAPQCDAMDVTVWDDRILCALRAKDTHFITFYSARLTDREWKKESELAIPIDGWFHLFAAKSQAWLLYEKGFLELDGFRSASGFLPPCTGVAPWSGTLNYEPFILLGGKELWRFRK